MIWKKKSVPKKTPTERAIKDAEQANIDTSEVVSDLKVSSVDAELIIADLVSRVTKLEEK